VKGFTLVNDSLTTSMNIGAPGKSSWDFTGLKSSLAVSLSSTPVAGTTFAKQFPAATHALKGSLAITISNIPVNATAYLYFQLTKNAGGATGTFSQWAMMADGTLYGLIPGVGRWLNTRADTMFALPVAYPGTSWTSSYTDTADVWLNGVLFSSIPQTIKTHKVKYVVDAYGPMKMAGGTYDALRIKKIDSTSTGVVKSFIFISNALSRVQVNAADPSSPDSGTIAVTSPTTWNASIPTSVQVNYEVPGEFALLQNYPNPFNPSTAISYQLPAASEVTLRVYDMLGREVATLVNAQQAPGTYSVSFDGAGLSSGVYLYRLTAGQFITSHKMVLTK
jgi:hypothetical protein